MSRKVFGIDLGTTYSCVSGFDEFGKNIVYKNSEGQCTTPSVVTFSAHAREVKVGLEAKEEEVYAPERTIVGAKRQMGTDTKYREPKDEFGPEMVSALILKKLAQEVREKYREEIHDVVITCPAYFGINERKATQRAGELAGFNVLSIINEPTAAAFAYGMGRSEGKQTALVFDLGGGTFDVTIIEIGKTAIDVIATGGNSRLGGLDWDNKVAEYFVDKLVEQQNLNKQVVLNDQSFMTELRLLAEKRKRQLSDMENVRVNFSFKGKSCNFEFSRDEFDNITAGLLEQTLTGIDMVLDDAREKLGGRSCQLDAVLLVGGSSRMPQVKKAVQTRLGMEVKLYNPDEAVARGAALYARQVVIGEMIKEETGRSLDEFMLSSSGSDFSLSGLSEIKAVAERAGFTLGGDIAPKIVYNVCSKSFGDKCMIDGKEVVVNIIMKNTRLPCTKTEGFATRSEGQTSISFYIMENELSERVIEVDDCVEQATYAVDNLPPGRPAGMPVEVTLTLDEQGLLHATGLDVDSGKRSKLELKTTKVISVDEMRLAKDIVDKYTILPG